MATIRGRFVATKLIELPGYEGSAEACLGRVLACV